MWSECPGRTRRRVSRRQGRSSNLSSTQCGRRLFDGVLGAVQFLAADAVVRQQVDDGAEGADEQPALEEEGPKAIPQRRVVALFRSPDGDGGDGATNPR